MTNIPSNTFFIFITKQLIKHLKDVEFTYISVSKWCNYYTILYNYFK